MKGIIKIVTGGRPIQEQALEFDISKLDPKTNRELKDYVENCNRIMLKN